MKVKKCSRCKRGQRSAPWVCQNCGARTCEHFCSMKAKEGFGATCNSCLWKSAHEPFKSS